MSAISETHHLEDREEAQRLAILRSYDLLDSEPERVYDDMTRLASQLLGTPTAVISLIDRDRQWFKSRVGIDEAETSRELSFCARMIPTGEPLVVEDATQDARFRNLENVTKEDGIRFYAGVPLKAASGHVLGSLCVIDSKPRVISDAEMTTLSTLARQVADQFELRRFSLEMARACSAAERSSQQLSEHLANVSHEIRTPLSGIMGAAQLLLARELSPRDHELARVINVSAGMLVSLLNDVLDNAKIEAGKLSIERSPFSLRAVIEDTAALHGLGAEMKGIRVVADLAPDLAAYYIGDRLRIGQIVGNLVSNAVKFTDEGAVYVRARSAPNGVEIDVTDTGIGIPEDRQSAVFESFEQAEESTARERGGTGLGLAIVKKLCELMGGGIRLTSQPGVGSTFHVFLPLPESSVEEGRLSGCRVLLADDDTVSRMVAERMIESLGCEVTAVSTGYDALAKLEEKEFDLVVSDIRMPDMDGESLRTHIAGRVPVVALTGMHRESLAEGWAGVVEKPVRIAPLRSALASALERT